MLRLRTAFRAFVAAVHKWIGGAWFHVGRHDRSRRHFERVLELRGDDFTAYVYLARLAYSTGDSAGWRRECEHARRTSPERYARLKHPFELFEPRGGVLLGDGGERATWRSFGPGRVGMPQSARRRRRRGACAQPEDRLGDDFDSEAERDRFRELGPVTLDEIRDVDLDDLSQRLSG
jgi:hypothetical protein